jgi:hypothetical protein
VCKSHNLTAICEPIDYTMWDPQLSEAAGFQFMQPIAQESVYQTVCITGEAGYRSGNALRLYLGGKRLESWKDIPRCLHSSLLVSFREPHKESYKVLSTAVTAHICHVPCFAVRRKLCTSDCF